MIIKEFKFVAIFSNSVKIIAETYEKCREAAEFMIDWFGNDYTISEEYDHIVD